LSDADKATYRVEVGRSHGAGPGNIVGAIANEAGLERGEIGKIKMFDRHSFIDLPAGLAEDLLDVLRNVQVSGQRLQLSESSSSYGGGSGRRDRSNRRRSNNGSTDFGKRQKPYRGRNSISRSEGFGGDSGSSYKGKSEGRSSSKPGGGSSRKPNQASTKARFSKSSAGSESKSFGESSRSGGGKSKAKPAKKYIKVRTKK